MQIIPIEPVPSQVFSVILGTQICQISLYQRLSGLYCDLYVNDALIVAGVVCYNLNRIVLSLYLGFIGDLIFIDNEGSADPYYTGLGDRFSLAWLELDDLNGQG